MTKNSLDRRTVIKYLRERIILAQLRDTDELFLAPVKGTFSASRFLKSNRPSRTILLLTNGVPMALSLLFGSLLISFGISQGAEAPLSTQITSILVGAILIVVFFFLQSGFRWMAQNINTPQR